MTIQFIFQAHCITVEIASQDMRDSVIAAMSSRLTAETYGAEQDEPRTLTCQEIRSILEPDDILPDFQIVSVNPRGGEGGSIAAIALTSKHVKTE